MKLKPNKLFFLHHDNFERRNKFDNFYNFYTLEKLFYNVLGSNQNIKVDCIQNYSKNPKDKHTPTYSHAQFFHSLKEATTFVKEQSIPRVGTVITCLSQ